MEKETQREKTRKRLQIWVVRNFFYKTMYVPPKHGLNCLRTATKRIQIIQFLPSVEPRVGIPHSFVLTKTGNASSGAPYTAGTLMLSGAFQNELWLKVKSSKSVKQVLFCQFKNLQLLTDNHKNLKQFGKENKNCLYYLNFV